MPRRRRQPACPIHPAAAPPAHAAAPSPRGAANRQMAGTSIRSSDRGAASPPPLRLASARALADRGATGRADRAAAAAARHPPARYGSGARRSRAGARRARQGPAPARARPFAARRLAVVVAPLAAWPLANRSRHRAWVGEERRPAAPPRRLAVPGHPPAMKPPRRARLRLAPQSSKPCAWHSLSSRGRRANGLGRACRGLKCNQRASSFLKSWRLCGRRRQS